MYKLPNDILYVDLNSCFATIEQQARPLLRQRPVAITNRLSPNACIIAASYEAKAAGIKVGMRRIEATAICPNLVYAETEPSKYIYVHQKLRQIMASYSPVTVMKSIDEGVIDLKFAAAAVRSRARQDIAKEIKARLKTEIGCYMRCNIGISSNRFLAKTAAELHKPDGLDEISADNQRQIFAKLKLTDLPGINTHMQARLNAVNIFTPLQLLDTDEATLVKLVCHSIDGHKWYQRLRGIEVDDYNSEIKTIGRQYVLESNHLQPAEIEARVIHLAEDVGYRLRSKQLYARGLYLWVYDRHDVFHHRAFISKTAFNTDYEIMQLAKQLFTELPTDARIVGVTLYKLQSQPSAQLCFNQPVIDRQEQLSHAVDQINLRFGSRTVHSAFTLNTNQVKTKIPFGSTRYLDHSLN